jgi:hypothetical protein
MDNAAEQYDLIAVLWRLDGFKGMEDESGQGHSIEEDLAAADFRRVGPVRKLVAWLGRLVRQ